MAHRNIKITRDILQTCHQVRSFNKSDLHTASPLKPAEHPEEAPETVSRNKPLCTVVRNSKNECELQGKTVLPELNVNELMNNAPEKLTTPLYKSVRTHSTSTFYSKSFGLDTTSNVPFANFNRQYSTRKKGEACKPLKCQRNPQCPKFTPEDCMPSKGSNCKRLYIDPCCTKKLAPYPSYSELCAYRLEDDPSECQQCPWQRCGGVDEIKPQKKRYHTSTRPLNMAMIPTKTTYVPLTLHKECDATKEPCKEPPPKCKKEEKPKCPEKKKCPEEKKKCSELFDPVESWMVSGSMRNLDLQRLYFAKIKLDRMKEEINDPSNLAQQLTFELKDCPKKEKCPRRKIFPPDVDHTIDASSLSVTSVLVFLCKVLHENNALELAREHDKGHPPPCDDGLHPKSEKCPDDADVKPKYRKERDITAPAYRRKHKPYSKDQDLPKKHDRY